MPRLNQREQVTTSVRQYLTLAETHSPEEYPLDVRSVSRDLGISPTTLYKYGLNKEINEAEERRRKSSTLSSRDLKQRADTDTIRNLKADLEKEQERNRGLVATIAVIEINAARLGLDPEELYKPVAKPNRSVSRSGRGRSGGLWPLR